ncbi:hypothetical protein [Actinokineospora sp. UTMC 2448]|uniref:hypothetical protein n=1 Tax=Actinokineospora sp. UTMC 2448 TaxID=2268449 RepID=UPI0021643EEB|nr:hypothetical protein [Actinokineospora sp. UTMC 2448]UVS79474.1 hypothetical protein Actkin_03222 [Actinokineospora sp. UTMC 2448]
MFRTAVLAAATFAAAGLSLLIAAPAQATADDCLKVLQWAGHNVTEQTVSACRAGENDFSACIVGLSEDGVQDGRIIVAACASASLNTEG